VERRGDEEGGTEDREVPHPSSAFFVAGDFIVLVTSCTCVISASPASFASNSASRMMIGRASGRLSPTLYTPNSLMVSTPKIKSDYEPHYRPPLGREGDD